ncbi:hypothetical protein [Jannaschia pohangensis]|uniref:Uncharacterized protein n=1 Tax=Jannaschia pohangensis TaxID=390807 RepID=A0A1I3GRW5_9RHOB|nr:hypothetical protein [Jannaschia pohangensis]SFI26248.1 hypothetical protein SAMN04488095_0308 [Jannaschia pohangensis]
MTDTPRKTTHHDIPTKGFGPSGATPKPEKEGGKYDKPSRPSEDFAIDEQRLRRLKTPPKS